MITAIDTNILLDILVPNKEFVQTAISILEKAVSEGQLIICDLVYAELCTYFEVQAECDEFLSALEIRVEPISREAQFLASRVWRAYRKQGGPRTSILPDFLIGAHAKLHAEQLVSRDRGFYRSMFPDLRLIDPAALQPSK